MTFQKIFELLEEKKNFISNDNYDKIVEILKEAEEKEINEIKEAPQTDDKNIDLAEKHKIEGNNHFKANDFHEALLSYSQAIDINPLPIYYSNRAAAYAKLDMIDEGIDDCLKAIELDKGFGKAYIRLGDFYKSKNDQINSLAFYNKALELEPNNINLQNKIENAKLQNQEKNFDPNNFDPDQLKEMMDNPEIQSMAENLFKNKSKEELREMFDNMFKKK